MSSVQTNRWKRSPARKSSEEPGRQRQEERIKRRLANTGVPTAPGVQAARGEHDAGQNHEHRGQEIADKGDSERRRPTAHLENGDAARGPDAAQKNGARAKRPQQERERDRRL